MFIMAMYKKGEYATTTPSLEEDYLGGDITPFLACKNYDETISTIHTTQSYGVYEKQHLQQQAKNRNGAKRILLVDDEDDINLTIKLVLEGSGFKVDAFSNPLLALGSYKTGLYDLVILDVKMPVMNGFGLYQEIRKLDDKVRICFLTAAGNVYYEAFGKEAIPNFGDEKYIIRMPIQNELLIKQIRSLVYYDP